MTAEHDDLMDACIQILREAHVRGSDGETGFLTAYQIWLLLRERNPEFCECLVDICGDAVGKGGGDQDGPAKRIANALGRSSKVETQYIDTSKLFFGDTQNDSFSASGQTCGLFRLR